LTSAKIDVLGIGNAIVDVLARAGNGFVETHGLVKGSMNLIGEARADERYETRPAPKFAS
jgi:hypothetical protein